MNRSVPLLLLAAEYIAALGLAASLIHFDVGGVPLAVAFDALVYAAAALVGMWAGLGRHSKLAGFVGVGAAMALIAALVSGSLYHTISGPLGPGNDVWVVLWLVLQQLALFTLNMAIVIVAMLWLRQRGVTLTADPNATGAELEPIRFSLRQLFLLTAVVGIMLKLGPLARASLNDYRSYVSSLVALASGGMVLGATGLVGLWAIRGGPISAARMAVAVLLAASFGFLPPYYFPALLTDDIAASVAATTLETVIVMAALAIVRAVGWRLARRVDDRAGQDLARETGQTAAGSGTG